MLIIRSVQYTKIRNNTTKKLDVIRRKEILGLHGENYETLMKYIKEDLKNGNYTIFMGGEAQYYKDVSSSQNESINSVQL